MRSSLAPGARVALAWVGTAVVLAGAWSSGCRSSEHAERPGEPARPESDLATPAASADAASAPAHPSEPPSDALDAPPRAAEDAARAQDAPYPIHGAVGTRARARRRDDESDVDVYATLDLEAGDVERHDWTARLNVQAIADVDGREPLTSPFFSLEDAQGSGARVYLYEAYAERHRAGDLESVRLGRQTLYDTPLFLWIDGASARTRPFGKQEVEIGAYGGVAVHQFETSHSGDRAYGAWTSALLAPRTHARADWTHVDDGERFDGASNDLVQLALGQGLGEHLRLDGAYSNLDGSDRDARVSALWADSESDLVVRASWYQLLRTQQALAVELDPFTTALLAQHPYWQTQLGLSKGLGKHVRVDAGADVRRLVHEGDEGTFNHDFDRWYLTTTFTELPLGLELALTGEVLDAGTNDVDTWGAAVSRRFGEGGKRRLSFGTAYALYKLDLFQVDEREDVRTWFVRWVDRKSEGWSFDLGYEYEDDPGQDLQLVRAGVLWSF